MAPPRRVYRCGRCNRAFKTGEERLSSQWSGLSYCLDIDACGRRASRWSGRPDIVWRDQRERVVKAARRVARRSRARA